MKSSCSAKHYGGTEPHDLIIGCEVTANLPDQFFTFISTGIKAKERFSENMYLDSSGIAGPLPKLRDGECLYISKFKSTVDAKAS